MGNRNMRKRVAAMLLGLLLLTGCTAPSVEEAPEPSPQSTGASVFALVVKSLENPYMQTMYAGFESACNEFGALAELHGPDPGGAPDQAGIVQDLIERKVDAIAIAANDMNEVSPMLREAREAGIPVVSLDSMVEPDARVVHIQQTSPEMIGRVLIQACAQIMEGEGEFAILTTTDSMPNQASWLEWMHHELADNAAQYAGMTLAETVYGLDEAGPSAAAARHLLETYPDLKVIIAPTVVGMRATAEEIARAGAQVKLTGLGLPSEMAPYITSGVCPWMYLWNPSEVGYLAAYVMDALTKGTVQGVPGEILTAGDIGDRMITVSADGGNEIVLGNPKVFDTTNIAVWGELF